MASVEKQGVELYSGTALVSSGLTMTNKTLQFMGCDQMMVYQNGMANRTKVEEGGRLSVFNGGTVSGTIVNAGNVLVMQGALAMNTAIGENGALILSGGTASGVSLSDMGNLEVYTGTAEGITITDGGNATVYGGSVSNATLSGDEWNVGSLQVVSGGAAKEITVNYGGCLTIGAGSMLSGTLQIADGGTVSLAANATFDFSVATQTSPGTALVNNWSLITAAAGTNYTLTVSTEQSTGTYALANGAGNFAGTVTVKTVEGGTLGTLSVGGKLVTENTVYTLTKTGGALSLQIEDNKPFITITAASDVKMYDGTALSNSGYTFTQGVLTAGDQLVVTVEGTITDAGTAANKVTGYKVMRGSLDVTDSYNFTASVDGTLEIIKRSMTLTSGDATKAYDGTPLTNSSVTISGNGFAYGEYAICNVTGSQLDAGSSANTFTYTLTENTKAGNYNITTKEGTLTVTKNSAVITITAASASKTYDGTALTEAGYTFTQGVLASGDELVVTVEGTITDAGTAANQVTGYKVMRGDVDVTGNYTFADSVDGTLTITQRNVTLTSDSKSRKYDGTALTGEVTVTGDGFVAGEATASASSITDAGSITNTITINEGTGYKASNYNITKEEGTLEVTKREVTLTSGDAVQEYDGTPLVNHNVKVSGDGFAANEGASYNVTGSQLDVGSSANTFTYTLNSNTKAENYDVTKEEGTLTVTPAIQRTFFVTGDFAGIGTDYLGKEGDTDSVLHIYQTGAEWGNTAMEDDWTFYDSLDFNGNGKDDLLRSNAASKLVVGEVSNGDGTFTPQVLNALGTGWKILGTGDFNGNGVGDVLVANPTAASATVGLIGYWEGGTTWELIGGYSAEWKMIATNDFNGDGKTDMLWKNSFIGADGQTYNAYCTWIVDDANSWRMVSVANPDEWSFLCAGDFDGDNTGDIAMINGEGVVGIWGIEEGTMSSWSILSAVDTNTWELAGVGDFNGDGTDDIAWCNSETNLAGYWEINNKQLTGWQNIATLA